VVSFGEVPGTGPKVVDGSTIEVTPPPQAAGKIDIRVDADGDLIAVAPGAFEYKS
jgi:hypothetical protein